MSLLRGTAPGQVHPGFGETGSQQRKLRSKRVSALLCSHVACERWNHTLPLASPQMSLSQPASRLCPPLQPRPSSPASLSCALALFLDSPLSTGGTLFI